MASKQAYARYWSHNDMQLYEKLTTSLVPQEKILHRATVHCPLWTSALDTLINCTCSVLNTIGARGLSRLTQM